MALQKTITLEAFGEISEAYHRVKVMNLTRSLGVNPTLFFQVETWFSQEFREKGKPPIDSRTFTVELTDEAVDAASVAQGYEVLKGLSEFDGSKDV